MVESGKSTPAEDLNSVVDRLLAEGADGAKIHEMVAQRIAAHPQVETAADIADYSENAETPPGNEGRNGELPIYTELPEGLIDLPSAAREYGIQGATLRMWIQRGKLIRRGRLKAPAAGGGYVVVRKADIEYCKDHPLKTGRKPKRVTT